MDKTAAKAVVDAFGQEQILRFWDELGSEERDALVAQLETLDLALVDELVREHVTGAGGDPDAPKDAARLEPAPVIRLPDSPESEARARAARKRGEALLSEGRVAAFVVAGGQGSRLGFDGPKGAFRIGPVTDRTLFQHHAEKIRALSKRYGVTIPWYVMTSETNNAATVEFFRRHENFGFAENDLSFFNQEMLPAVDRNGKILMASKSHIFTSPNGHGGSLKALHESGALADMRERDIDTIFYFQVDNPLAVICDPTFLGYHALEEAEMSSKVVRKTGPEERVGVVGLSDGRLTVIEYSDLPEDDARATLADGSLKFWAGSIAVHVLSVDFVARLNEHGFRLPYHVAQKKIAYVGDDGRLLEPEGKNGIKFETFVFDALGEAARSVTMEVSRADEFSPVKNATGVDSPEQSRRDMTSQFLRWIEKAGARVERQADGTFQGSVEISPLTALDADDVARAIASGTSVRDGFTI